MKQVLVDIKPDIGPTTRPKLVAYFEDPRASHSS